jgi:6-phosphogluconolactonase
MGADGHTLSIFPGSPVLMEKQRLVVPAPGANHERMTFTLEAMEYCKHKFFLVLGEEKKEMLIKVLNEKSALHPASMVLGADFYTDIQNIG